MVGEFLLDVVFGIVTGILSGFDHLGIFNIAWDVGSDKMGPFFEIVRSVCYFFPVGTVASIVGLIVAFACFRAVIRLIVTIWDLLPIA